MQITHIRYAILIVVVLESGLARKESTRGESMGLAATDSKWSQLYLTIFHSV